MVTAWGMSDRLGPVSFKLSDDDPFLGREMHQARQFSEHTVEVIDEEITKILRTASSEADDLLNKEKEKLEAITRALIAQEELDHRELVALIGPAAQTNSPFLFDAESEGTAGPNTTATTVGEAEDSNVTNSNVITDASAATDSVVSAGTTVNATVEQEPASSDSANSATAAEPPQSRSE